MVKTSTCVSGARSTLDAVARADRMGGLDRDLGDTGLIR
jgi:hypothetical protein